MSQLNTILPDVNCLFIQVESSLAIKNEFIQFENEMNQMNEKFVKK